MRYFVIRGQFAACLFLMASCLIVKGASGAEPLVNIRSFREAPLRITDAVFSSGGERIKPKKVCVISSCEENAVVKQGALLSLLEDKSVAGLELFGAPCESSVTATVYNRVHVEDGVLQDVGKLTQLEFLNLTGVDLTRGIGLQCFAKLENLRILYLTDCDVDVKQLLAHLPKCPKLEVVGVMNGLLQPPEKTKQLGKWPVLRAKEAARFTSGSPKLRELCLRSTEHYEPEAIAQFVKLAELDVLRIDTPDGAPDEPPKVTEQQKGEGKKLEKLLTEKGFKYWLHSAQPRSKSFRLSHTSIHVPELSERP